MKSFIITFLATALAAAAFYTRPGRRELLFHLIDSQTEQANRSWRKGDLEKADKVAKALTIHDRILWMEAEKDGQVIYTGAFAHWFESNPKEAKNDKNEKATVTEVARLLGKL